MEREHPRRLSVVCVICPGASSTSGIPGDHRLCQGAFAGTSRVLRQSRRTGWKACSQDPGSHRPTGCAQGSQCRREARSAVRRARRCAKGDLSGVSFFAVYPSSCVSAVISVAELADWASANVEDVRAARAVSLHILCCCVSRDRKGSRIDRLIGRCARLFAGNLWPIGEARLVYARTAAAYPKRRLYGILTRC